MGGFSFAEAAGGWKVESAGELSASLMTPLGVIEGEILTYLEQRGATALRRLIRELEWPAPLVMMAVGALVRDRLVRAARHDLEIIVEPDRSWVPQAP